MKTQTILALWMVVGGAGTVAYGQPGAGKKYDTRDPSVCKSTKEPAKGAPSPDQVKAYVLCNNESISGGYIWLIENLQVEMGKARTYSVASDSGNRDIDNSQPVYPIRGTDDAYYCRPPGSMGFPAGKNCNVKRAAPFVGTCYKTTFGDWSCPMHNSGDPLTGVTNSVPPPK